MRAEGVCTRVYIHEGRAVSAEGGSLRETLGRMLLRKGALSEADYVRVIERMTQQVIDNEHQRMGEVLVELGLMSSADVYGALSEQVAEKIVACFQSRRVRYSFDELDALPEGMEAFDIPPIPNLILQGLRTHVPAEELVNRFREHGAQRVRLGIEPALAMAEYGITSSEGRFLNRLDGSATLAALLAEGDPALLATLLWTGGARLERAKARAHPATATRSRPEFAREVVKPRRARAPKPATGATHRDGSSGTSTPAPPPDDNKARLEAEQLFRRAQGQLGSEKFADAVRTLAKVVELQPLEPEYRMFEAWAAYLQARVEVRVARAKAAACARRVAEADPQAGKPHAILGRLALDDGDHAGAAREFEAAILRDPEDPDAKKGMKLVRPR